MRITRLQGLNDGGYCNPSEMAHKKWKELHGSRYAISKSQAYREAVDELFSPSISLGYPIIATTDSGDCLCIDCAKKVFLDERTDVTVDIYYEGMTMYCDERNCEIESAYGDPNDSE
jgi:hypothetical protein